MRNTFYLMVVLFEEEMVGQMVENHGIGRVDGVGSAQLLHPVLDRIRTLMQEFVHQTSSSTYVSNPHLFNAYRILNSKYRFFMVKIQYRYLISSEHPFLLCI